MKESAFKWTVGLIALLALGCGGDKAVTTAPVSGTVYLDGKPLPGAEINFFSDQYKFLATGMTDDQGHYELYQGAALGKNKVWVTTKKVSDTNPVDESGDFDVPPTSDEEAQAEMTVDETAKGKQKSAKGEKVPSKFNSPDSTVLTFDVSAGGSKTADFRLSGK